MTGPNRSFLNTERDGAEVVKQTDNSQDNHNLTINRLAAVGEISAGIAHEIRNPLTAVKGFLQLMAQDYPSEHWDVVLSELDQAIGTVQELLSVAKPNLDSERPRYFSLCAEVENLLSLFHKEMYRVSVEKRFYNTDIKMYGKRNQIKKAMFNLLKNAFEAINGTGTISIEHFRSGDSLVLKIRDSGVGIPEDKLQLLGTPFFSMKDTGTGLGLSQVYSTFYQHGGDIKVNSSPEGTEFTISMPIETKNALDSLEAQLVFTEGQDVKSFFNTNHDQFIRSLESEARTTFEIVSESKIVTTDDLREHANQILDFVHDGLTQEIIRLAQERGVVWAQSDIPIISKMEWFYSLRKVIWRFLRFYHLHNGVEAEEAFEIADRITSTLDSFIIHFNVSFTRYRDNVLKSQQAIIDELNVPVIPLFNNVAVFPLIGSLDHARVRKVEERLLDEIEARNIQKLFIDLSGAAILDTETLTEFHQIIDGITLLGCTTVLTGIRAGMAKMMLRSKFSTENVTIESTLQQALLKESQRDTSVL
ncbi:ATP-binding protein [Alicyclobacillus dauci]|uniref:histidine kinase n=1 Tax=Alicyclobacillus dauci TaxID=1475485 RepID=A0ABY6Z5Y1_9BACL|nr:ATP-binding protein [Alicyclobacillus dauci]WAH38281.1 ATP-binding protein [Alicyclobacillus dauci]